MMIRFRFRLACLLLAVGFFAVSAISCRGTARGERGGDLPAIPGIAKPSNPNEPPAPVREFRAAWVATVANIDWPSKPGLTKEQQQKEIIQILDRAREINLNAIVLQVRTTADALYESKLEPWSYFLTGTEGKHPGYDPLQFWIEQAHARGMELHAWFNPYRTRYAGGKYERASNHVSLTRPDLAKDYGRSGWMDPGEPEAADHSFNVFMDVVERYDVDGIHIDDYFYPYPEADPETKKEIPFPDDPSYEKYRAAGGRLERNDWRRDNINRLIKRIYDGIRQRKAHVKFGISPFGIPRPGLEGIEYVRGFDQYDKLYADTVLWLQNGWCDYFVPQLYWKIGAPQQPYLGLLNWWVDNNPKNRNIYGGLFTSRINFTEETWRPDEILGQIMITRLTSGAHGNVHFSMIALAQNRQNLAGLLRDGLYAQPALVPTSPWLDRRPPAPPREVRVERVPGDTKEAVKAQTEPPATQPAATQPTTRPARPATRPYRALATQPAPDPKLGAVRVTWSPGGGDDKPFVWAIYSRHGDDWRMTVVPARQTEALIRDSATAGPATRIAVAAVDRNGNESRRTTVPTGLKQEKEATRE